MIAASRCGIQIGALFCLRHLQWRGQQLAHLCLRQDERQLFLGSSATALRAPDLSLGDFARRGSDKSCAELKIAAGCKTAPACASSIRRGNRENAAAVHCRQTATSPLLENLATRHDRSARSAAKRSVPLRENRRILRPACPSPDARSLGQSPAGYCGFSI